MGTVEIQKWCGILGTNLISRTRNAELKKLSREELEQLRDAAARAHERILIMLADADRR